MTTTMQERTRNGSLGHQPAGLRISPTKPRRNGALIAAGVLLTVGCGLIAVVLQLKATSKTAVLAVAHQVPAGQEIRPSDLSTVTISGGAGLQAIAAADSKAVVGRTAAVTLMPGTLVSRNQLSDGTSVAKGKVVVGLSLKPGQVPTPHLKAGDEVLVVATGPAAQMVDGGRGVADNDPRGAVLVRRATVYGVDGGSRDNDSTTVSILVDEPDAPAVAGAGSANSISLVLQSAP